MPAKEGRSAILALILSLFVPGAGQFYVGQLGKGFMFILLCGFAWFLISTIIGMIVGIPLLLILPIWAAIDAYKAAKG